jgi:hypothetical protein
MAKQGSKIDVGSTFHGLISAIHPSASFSSFDAKRFSDNTRILLPSDAGAAGNEKGVVLKLKKVTVAAIPRSKFAPLVITTQTKGTSLLGARLTSHGGEIAVELARRLARKAAMRLVVLGTNIIALLLVDAGSSSQRTPGEPSSNHGADVDGRRFIEESIEKLRKITEDFNARIDALLDKS